MEPGGLFQPVAHGQPQALAAGALGPDLGDRRLVEPAQGVEDPPGLLGEVGHGSQIVDLMPGEQRQKFGKADDPGLFFTVGGDVGGALSGVAGDHGDRGLGGVVAVLHARGLGPLAVGRLADHGLVHSHLAQDFFQRLQGQPAGPEQPGRRHGQINDGALHADAAGAAVHNAVDLAPHVLHHMSGGGGAGTARGIARGGGNGNPGPANDLQGQGMVGAADAHGLQTAGGPQRYDVPPGQDHGQGPGPEPPGQGVGRMGDVPAEFRQPAGVGNMENQRVVLGTALGLEDMEHRGLIEPVGPEAIDGLRGNPQQPAAANDGRRPVQISVRQRLRK